MRTVGPVLDGLRWQLRYVVKTYAAITDFTLGWARRPWDPEGAPVSSVLLQLRDRTWRMVTTEHGESNIRDKTENAH